MRRDSPALLVTPRRAHKRTSGVSCTYPGDNENVMAARAHGNHMFSMFHPPRTCQFADPLRNPGH